MFLKKLTKKITAGITAAVLGLSITFSAPATVEAFGLGDAVNIGATIFSASAAYKQINKQVKALNDTEDGRESLYQSFRQQYGVSTDPAINARMDRIMQNLTNAVGQVDPSIYDKPYKYFVSANETLNAACGMGHVMMVNVGTFYHLPTDDEIAAIVGHEMGHGQKDHVVKGQKKTINKAVLAQVGSAALGGDILTNAVITVATKNSIASSDKKMENEADSLSWEYMLHTDYNIGAGAAVMQRLSELYGGKKRGKLQSWLNPSDHPNTDKRRDNYAKKLYEYSGKHAEAKDGVITINGKTFTTVAATDSMSSAERSFFVLGNLAKAYHNGKNVSDATVYNGTVYLGDMAIITPAYGDEDAHTLAERLNAIK